MSNSPSGLPDPRNRPGQQRHGDGRHAGDVAAAEAIGGERRHRGAGALIMGEHAARFLQHHAADVRQCRFALAFKQGRANIEFKLLQRHRDGGGRAMDLIGGRANAAGLDDGDKAAQTRQTDQFHLCSGKLNVHQNK